MAVLTDKEYYLDDTLIKVLEIFLDRQKKGYDNLMIIDGKERIGKSTLARSIAYYLNWKNKKEFGIKNVFFDLKELMKFAIENREETIIWDEAAFGGLSSQWQGKVQQQLIRMLMVTGKYHHNYIFIIPNFFRLTRYLALDRSIALIHCYSPDMETRGLFTCFNEQQKVWIYNNYKKSETYGKSMSFRGKFTLKNTETIVPEDEYEAKKDAAIRKEVFHRIDEAQAKLNRLQFRIATLIDPTTAASVCEVDRKTIYHWKKMGKEWGFAGNDDEDRIDELESDKSDLNMSEMS